MTNQEIVTKIIVSKHALENIFMSDSAEYFKTLINGQKERLLDVVEKEVMAIPYEDVPKELLTDEFLSGLIFKYEIAIRAAILIEFMPKTEHRKIQANINQ